MIFKQDIATFEDTVSDISPVQIFHLRNKYLENLSTGNEILENALVWNDF